MSFEKLFEFEKELAEFAGAPYAIVTDGCTHALELCLRYDKVQSLRLTPWTYLSVPQLFRQLGIKYEFIDQPEQKWVGEYPLIGTRIWDSARLLKRGMYRSGQLQCLSFGYSKPLEVGKVGAILTNDTTAYHVLSRMRSDGRDLRINPWQDQTLFEQGWHYCPTLEDCQRGLEKLSQYSDQEPKYHKYPDLRLVKFA